jgi:protein tyrosine/serine phosphatase
MRKILWTSLILAVAGSGLGLVYAGCQTPETAAPAQDTYQRLDLPGLPNFYRVSDQLYRGGQIEAAGVAELKKLGVKTVVNFSGSEQDYQFFRDSGIRVDHLPMSAFFPEKQLLREFLDLVADPARTPVFVHCIHGADRTGAAVALYRIHIQKWDKEKAIAEMTGGPFGFHRIHSHLKQFIRDFQYPVH